MDRGLGYRVVKGSWNFNFTCFSVPKCKITCRWKTSTEGWVGGASNVHDRPVKTWNKKILPFAWTSVHETRDPRTRPRAPNVPRGHI